MNRKNKILLLLFIVLLLNVLYWSLSRKEDVFICNSDDFKISSSYYKYLSDEHLVDSLCLYKSKIIDEAEFRYLHDIFELKDDEATFVKDKFKIYNEIIINSDLDMFAKYYNDASDIRKSEIKLILGVSAYEKSDSILSYGLSAPNHDEKK